MLSKDDRIALSLQIVKTADELKGIDLAQDAVGKEIEKLQKIDTANKNLFDPVNLLTNGYQNELNKLDGNLRTTIVEQDIVDSANKKVQNHFFPNDITVTVPSLAASHNIWTKIPPFAITYAIGKNYTEAYGSTPKEPDILNQILGYITSAGSYTDIQLTTGQQCVPTDIIQPYVLIQTLKSDLVTAVNNLKAFLLAEVAVIVTNDPDTGNQANNNAAINNINNVIIPALDTWLGYVDFNTAHGQTTCAGFNGYNSNLLAPTKLHSVQLAALQSAIIARSSFVTTRISQVTTVLGTISQDLSTGDILSSSGLYGKRYKLLSLRLNLLNGSLVKLASFQYANAAQTQLKATTISNKETYYAIIPTSIFKAPGNGTNIVHLVDVSFLNPGDTVYVMSEGQEELQRAIRSISGNMVTLNDIVPAKYRQTDKARLYKDLS